MPVATLQYFVPDGYEPDGTSRPWREIRVVSVSGPVVMFRYCDDNETGSAMASSVELREVPEDPGEESAAVSVSAYVKATAVIGAKMSRDECPDHARCIDLLNECFDRSSAMIRHDNQSRSLDSDVRRNWATCALRSARLLWGRTDVSQRKNQED